MKILKESKLVENVSYKVSYKINGKNHFSTVSAENEKEATRIVSDEITKKYGNTYQFIGVEEVTNESMDADDLSYYYDEEDIIDALNDVWVEVGSKSIPDSNGFLTDYTMYRHINTGEYVFVFGDKDIYRPEDGYFDWECETEEEAQEWFDNYHGFEESDFEESYEVDKVFSAACNNRMDYMKKGFAKGKINPNDRFNRFNSDHSYIMGALRNGNKDMVKFLQDQGGTIIDNEQDEYNRLMGEEFEKEETINNDEKVYTKSNGDYLIKASSGHGYTAYNKSGVCIGGITTDSETEAKNKFMSNKLDEKYKGYNRARRLDESLFEDADEFEFDDEFNAYYDGYTEEDKDKNSAYNKLKNNVKASINESEDKYVIYKENGTYKGTPKSNYGGRISNDRLIQTFDDFESPEEIVDYMKKYSKQKSDDDYEIINESKSIRESDEDKPYTKEEVERDLKSITHNFTDKDGELKCGFEEEKNFCVEILKKHYKVVETSGDDRREGTWYHISFAEPKNVINESSTKTFPQWFDETQRYGDDDEFYPFENYVKQFPNAEILRNATAEDIRDYAHRFYSVYDVDSIDREKAFNFASEELGIDYDDLYNAWIYEKPIGNVNESMLQDLHKDHKAIKDTYGQEVYDALDTYVENGNDLGDVLYKESEWNKFAQWLKKDRGIDLPKQNSGLAMDDIIGESVENAEGTKGRYARQLATNIFKLITGNPQEDHDFEYAMDIVTAQDSMNPLKVDNIETKEDLEKFLSRWSVETLTQFGLQLEKKFGYEFISDEPIRESHTLKVGDKVYVTPNKKNGVVTKVDGDYVTVETDDGKDPIRVDTYYANEIKKLEEAHFNTTLKEAASKNEIYKDYVIVVDPAGDGYNVFSKKGNKLTLEDEGFASINHAKAEIDKWATQNESFEDNDTDKPFTYTQIYDELKRETFNFTTEKDSYRYGFLKEAEMAQKILAKHYAYAELDSVGSWFQIDFGDPKKKSKKFRR